MERKNAVKAIYNLSPMQEGMLFHSLLNPGSHAYFEQFSCTADGSLDAAVLEQSFNRLIERYDILRTNFVHEHAARPKQVVFKERMMKIRYEDISHMEEREKIDFLENYRIRDKNAGFDLAKEILLRFSVLRTSDSRYHLIWSYHHILMDGWCLKTIVQELFETYHAIKKNLFLPDRPSPPPYSEYIKWLDKQDREEAQAFWSRYLAGYESKAELPKFQANRTPGEYKQADQVFSLSEEVASKLERVAQENQVTLNTVLQTAWGLLLARYNNTRDVVFGMVSSGRPTEIEGFESMVGLFIHAIPVRIAFQENDTFAGLIKKMQDQSVDAKNYDYFPLAEIQSLSVMKHNLIDHLYGFQYFPADGEYVEAVGTQDFIITEEEDFEQSNYDFNVIIMPNRGLDVLFKYNACVYSGEFASRLGCHFANLLNDVCENPNRTVSEIEILTEQEIRQLLYAFNDSKKEYPEDVTIHELIERTAECLPDHPAVVFNQAKLTYRELNERANRLALLLREKGVKPDSIVAIMVEHSLEMVVGVLGILKAGGSYLPIDPNYPMDRVKYLLRDSEAALLLTRCGLVDDTDANVQVLELESLPLDRFDVSNPEPVNTAADLAYVIYTSGSTGKPKGVAVEHRSLVNMSLWHKDYYGMTEADKCTKYLGFGFDASVSEIFPCLIAGSTLYMIPDEMRMDVESLNAFYTENGITISSLPTAITEQFLQLENRSLTRLITGGDKLKTYKKTGYALYNNYGPTENTVCSTSFKVEAEYANIPIGRPVSNVNLYILDGEHRLVPVGVPGELCISGKSLARGYLHKPELTAEKFIPHPFEQGERLYKTGDLARWLPCGNIEFLGRLDQQVKIRGFRIELGEIENQLLKLKETKEAVVAAIENPLGETVLCAYLALHVGVTAGTVKERLSAELPDYMIPKLFVFLDRLPLTQNGKVDKQALPRPDFSQMDGARYIAPRNETEAKLADIWKQVLGVDRAGTASHFFELGGHSLNAVKLVSAIKKEFQVVIPLGEVFRTPVLGGMAKLIQRAEGGLSTPSPIEPVPKAEYYPVSSVQKRLFVLSQLEGQETVYNTPTVLHIQGETDIARLEAVFAALIRRHEALRTSFEFRDDEPVQRIHEHVDFHITRIEISDKAQLQDALDRFVVPFDLGTAPLMRVGIAQVAEKEHVMIVDFHHIIADGTSIGVLVREFNSLYGGQDLPECRIQYKDYAAWQNKLAGDGTLRKQEQYWLDRFQGEIPVLNMPVDYARTNSRGFEGDNVLLQLDSALTARIQRLAAETGSTMYMVLLAACHVWLYKYSGQEDTVIGSPIAGRTHADVERVIGMFVNTLSMRNYPAGGKTFSAFLGEVKQNSLQAFENQQFQFEDLVEKLNPARDFGRNPLFDIMLAVQNLDHEEIVLDSLQLKPYPYESRTAKFDLTITATEDGERITLDFEYAASLYKKQTVERLAAHFRELLKSITDNPETKLCELNMLSDAERHELLTVFNDTRTEYRKDRTIQQLFEEQVECTPDQLAVVFGDGGLTYRELNDRANRLARILRDKSIRPDSIVGILGDRSIETVISMLGVLKAGGAYLPIDPAYPVERIAYMLKDSRAGLILSGSRAVDQVRDWVELAGTDAEILVPDRQPADPMNASNLPVINTADDLAYIIYTSGSTGLPKGVMVEHRGMLNMQVFYKRKLGLIPADQVVQFASLSFDASVWEIFMALLTGATLHLVSQEEIGDYRLFENFMEKRCISVATLPPTYLVHLDSSRMPSLRTIVTGGSESTRNIVNEWGNRLTYVNAYGPTESTICATIWESPKDAGMDDVNVPIGKPIGNTRIYIVDGNNQLLPVDVTGELCIAGDGLARGYINNEKLTNEKFVPNPFVPGEKMYRTGDLARWRKDGNIEFIGRADHQVKIRGYRVETGEVEAKLLQHERIQEAIVLAKKDKSNQAYLCAYLVSGTKWALSELRAYLAKSLPDYMIPSFFVQLDKMPLTSNGKPDHKALPEPDGEQRSGAEYAAPRDARERKLAEVWQEVLGLERIGVHHNFFELGGQSLKAAALAAKISKVFQVDFPLREVFRTPSLGEMGSRIRVLDKRICPVIEPAPKADYYPVSSAQKRLLILDRMEGVGISYHMPAILKLTGDVDLDRMNEAFRSLVQRHDSFRTSFAFIDGEPVQQIQEEADFAIEFAELDERIGNRLPDRLLAPFDLSRAPLLRVSVVKTGHGEQLLVVDMHHIISDGVSIGILVNEFNKLYNGGELNELKLQYKDFAVWQNGLLKDGAMESKERYWTEEFQAEIPVLNMPADFPRPKTQSFEGRQFSCILDPGLLSGIKRLAAETGTTLYMVLLAAYNVLLSKYTGQEDIIVGSPIAGRPLADLDSVIGMFVNTLAIRNQPEGGKSFKAFLEEVKESALGAFENQDYQYEELVEKLKIKRDLSRNPLFDTMFEVQNLDIREIELESIVIEPYSLESGISKFDITVTAIEQTEGLAIQVEYAAKLYKEDTIERFTHHFAHIIHAILENSETKIADIPMMPDEERHKILHVFNDTRTDYPKHKTIHQIFAEQAEKQPDKVALVYQDNQLTYGELNRSANRIAADLLHLGVQNNEVVGILADRSIEMVAGILGVLKAGGAYLPIDPEYPKERIAYMFRDSKSEILLIQPEYAQCAPDGVKVVLLKEEYFTAVDAANPANVNSPSDLAYVMYTSGSTGKPKGVMIEHKSVVRLVRDTNYAEFREGDRILQTGAQVFDACTFEIWGALLNGLELYVVPKLTILDPVQLEAAIRDYQITTMWLTSPLFNQLAQRKPDMFLPLKYLIVGGDALSPKTIQRVRSRCPALQVVNGYGPTENTTFSCCFPIEEDYEENIPIGKPISNSTAYVVDKYGKLNPIGVPGELWVGGDGVARGYINNPELTSQKFIASPFAPDEQLYCTGDLARWRPDGSIEYMGRIDNQVKIRGFRVEVGEIESRMLQHGSVKEAVVVVRDLGETIKSLCAYVVPEGELEAKTLKEYAAKHLPDYMVPSDFVLLDKLPLTPNGKLDRRALPEPDASEGSGEGYVAPRDEAENRIVQIWSELLGVQRISVFSNFFELGGHSLKAIQMINRLAEHGWEVSINQVFTHQTPAELAEICSRFEASVRHWIEDTAEAETFIQEEIRMSCKYVRLMSKDEVRYVLQVEGLNGSVKQRIEKWIAQHVAEPIRPHYIVDSTGTEWKPEIGEETFNWTLAAQHTADVLTPENVLAEVERMQLRFAECIQNSRVIGEYEASPSQQYHLTHKDISGTHIAFDHYLDSHLLNEVLMQLIGSQEMMRSVLKNDDGAFKWQLMEKPGSAQIPFIDLCGCYGEARTEILASIMRNFFVKEYPAADSIMYRLLLIRINLREHLLLLPFSHAIFDFMSGEIVKDAIAKAYACLEKGRQVEPKPVNSYLDYICQITQGPDAITDEEICKLFRLDEMMSETRGIRHAVQQYDGTAFTAAACRIPAGGEECFAAADGLWPMILGTCAEFFKSYFGIGKLPVWLTNYGRNYSGKQYFETVGECIDYIPILIDTDSPIHGTVADIQNKLRLAAEKNINFANLIYNKDMEEFFPQSKAFLKNSFECFPLNVNYLGELKEQGDILNQIEIDGVNCEEKNRIICMTWHQDGNLFITIVLPYKESREKVERLLEEASQRCRLASFAST